MPRPSPHAHVLNRRTRLALAGAVGVLLIAVIAAALGRGGSLPPRLPLPGAGSAARPGDPFAYSAGRQREFEARASAGSAHVLFTKIPGGVIATAARVAAYRSAVKRAAAASSVDPDILEGIVYLESAGRPTAIAGADPSAAAGLTQILAETGQGLLGMHVDLAKSRALTAAIDSASALGHDALVSRLQRQRAKIDDRFDPAKALAATVRYLELARQRFGRADLAVVSYHMGIGNLTQVLGDYDGGRAVPYAQVYFDSSPARNASTYKLLSSFGDDSSLYYWRVLGAVQIMRLYRSDRAALVRLTGLQTAEASQAEVLHPPDHTQSFNDPAALERGLRSATIRPLPSGVATLGLAYGASIGSLAGRLGVSATLYRGLRPAALGLLIELAARVRVLSGVSAPLTVQRAVTDKRYQRLLGGADPPASTGYTFQIARRYAGRGQALALQAMLDRLQALNLIAWTRGSSAIEITVASDAAGVIVNGV
ncbi:MAG: transglycosylase SLT domain-containing protein [Solirubrobacteraceae bacterium]